MSMQAVILAAGMGTRLGRPWPKPLTPLADGRTIMGQQMDNLQRVFGADLRVMTVVGFKLEMILEAFPDVAYVYNESYDQTNTNRSLLKALRIAPDGGVLWMNGDVVFDTRNVLDINEWTSAGLQLVTVGRSSPDPVNTGASANAA